MSKEYERYKRWWQSDIHRPVIDETKYKKIHGKEITSVFMDEAVNHSEAMKELNEIIEYITENKKVEYATILSDCEIIKDALLKSQEQDKVLEIIIKKNVDIFWLYHTLEMVKFEGVIDGCKYYNNYYAPNCVIDNNLKTIRNENLAKLTKKEFDLLKRWLENGN